MTFASLIGRVAFKPFSKALPPMGDTERAALEAGTVGFEGDLFAGRPDFDALLRRGPNRLTDDERHFLDNEVPALIAMLDDHQIDEARDLPPEVWQVLRDKKYFGMIIPREYGGLGFGHFAHAAVVTRIGTVNVAAAVTVMVPNSLGPAELLLRYGSEAQKAHYLPRLADGRELPCFGLTSPYAGSDAAVDPRHRRALRARGRRPARARLQGPLRQALRHARAGGHRRGPRLPGGGPERARRRAASRHHLCADPGATAGMTIGRRHRPMDSAFMNGPIRGDDVFVPMDWIIGGETQVGQGWRMLMESLAAGRSISLPALGSACSRPPCSSPTAMGRSASSSACRSASSTRWPG